MGLLTNDPGHQTDYRLLRTFVILYLLCNIFVPLCPTIPYLCDILYLLCNIFLKLLTVTVDNVAYVS
jgi:hypothetical protein